MHRAYVIMKVVRPFFNSTRISYSGNSIDGAYDQEVGAIAQTVNQDNRAYSYIFASMKYTGSMYVSHKIAVDYQEYRDYGMP
ncbi:MAG: hypothetical protein PVH88_09360 [Ignavibacteria bacterium]|jgi:hypothetical protein